ncbi:MAG TPA: hypothetical protein VK866_08515, partial [Acidimicrobiales bacterium]|nr:hypothetical protein [Acidimicrobiales bacterium]
MSAVPFRLLAVLAVIAVLGLAACGDDDEVTQGDTTTTVDPEGAAVNTTTTQVDLQWAESWAEGDRPLPEEGAPLPIDEYNDFLDANEAVFDVDDLELLTVSFLQLGDLQLFEDLGGDDLRVDVDSEPLDDGRTLVTATVTGLRDDSTAALRYEIVWED